MVNTMAYKNKNPRPNTKKRPIPPHKKDRKC
jgi:hypothetical protein